MPSRPARRAPAVPDPGPDPGRLPGRSRLLPALLDLVLPTPCAGCGDPGTRFCAGCAELLAHRSTRRLPGLPPVVVLARYAGPPRRTVLAYKERGRRDLARPLAAAVLDGLAAVGLPRHCVLVPAPSRGAAARARGGDHMVRLAREVARLGAPPRARGGAAPRVHGGASPGPGAGMHRGPRVVPALVLRRGARDSLGLDADARADNLRRHLTARRSALPVLADAVAAGVPVVLLDDVLTTGATARAATAVLASSGVPVTAVVVLTAVRHRVRHREHLAHPVDPERPEHRRGQPEHPDRRTGPGAGRVG